MWQILTNNVWYNCTNNLANILENLFDRSTGSQESYDISYFQDWSKVDFSLFLIYKDNTNWPMRRSIIDVSVSTYNIQFEGDSGWCSFDPYSASILYAAMKRNYRKITIHATRNSYSYDLIAMKQKNEQTDMERNIIVKTYDEYDYNTWDLQMIQDEITNRRLQINLDRTDMIKQLTEFDSSDKDVPSSFLCPITMCRMRYPVILSDGYTYEKRAITEWLSNHNLSPITKTLVSKTMFPNRILQDLMSKLYT